MGQQLLGKQCSNGNELAADHDVPSKDAPKSNKPCVDTSILEGSLDQTATTDPSAIEPTLVSTPLASKTTRVISDTLRTTADTSIENSLVNARNVPPEREGQKAKPQKLERKRDHQRLMTMSMFCWVKL